MQQNESVIVAWGGFLELAHLVWIISNMAARASNHTISALGNPGKSDCGS